MTVTLHIDLQPATRDDITVGNSPAYGEIFFLKRESDGTFEGPYAIKDHLVKSGELRRWYESDMIYVKKPGSDASLQG